MDIWGTWCPPCRAEIPHFVELKKKYGDKGLEIVGLNYEGNGIPDDEARRTIKEFAAEHNINYTLALGDETTREKVPNFEGYPTTLFIDRQGKVRAKIVGFDPSGVGQMEELIVTLLDETPTEAGSE